MDCNGTMETLAGDSRDPCSAGESKRVLILGGGFGGVYAALRLEKLLPTLNKARLSTLCAGCSSA